MMNRDYTCRVLDLVDEGVLDPTKMLEMALIYMSEDEVRNMLKANEIDLFFEELQD